VMVSQTVGRSRVALEICVESAVGAAAAIAGGCDRIELCSALALGGLTPSAGLVADVLALAVPAGVPVRAMVRPRAGGFDYDADDMALALAEARALVATGVQGLVIGVTAGGKLAEQAMRAWIAGLGEDRPPLTLHRAIDVVADPVAAVDVAVALGFDHVLTSGGARNHRRDRRRPLHRGARAAGRCTIMAGAGVAADTAAALLDATNAGALHGSASDPAPAVERDRFGFGPLPRQTNANRVAALRQVIDDKSNLRQL